MLQACWKTLGGKAVAHVFLKSLVCAYHQKTSLPYKLLLTQFTSILSSLTLIFYILWNCTEHCEKVISVSHF